MKQRARRASHWRASDLRGTSRLAVQATLGLTRLVENLHHNITRAPMPWGEVSHAATRGITGGVYRSIRGVTGAVGWALDGLLRPLEALLASPTGQAKAPGEAPLVSAERERVLAALNGVLGDHLADTDNPLAIDMQLWHDGRPLPCTAAALRGLARPPGGRVLLMLHGLCMHPLQWRRNGHDHGQALAEAGGFTALYLHYNSGRHVSVNGRLLSALMQQLQAAWPGAPPALALLCHSMGGLVARSAVAQAAGLGHDWPVRLQSLTFLGTPHQGAPLERGGHWVDQVLDASPYTAAFARLGRLRSAGITDLRHGSLLDSDWSVPHQSAVAGEHRTPVPLPAGVACHAAAASLHAPDAPRSRRLLGLAFGDGLVPVDSALGRHALPRHRLAFDPARQAIVPGVGHLGLLDSPAVAAQLRRWLVDETGSLPGG